MRPSVAEQIGKASIGRFEDEADGIFVDRLHALDKLEVDPGHRSCRGIQDALDRLQDVVGIELAPVMPFDALAEAEGPGLEVVTARPAFGEIGFELAVVLELGQAAKDEEVDDILLADLRLGRIERIDIREDANLESAPGSPGRPRNIVAAATIAPATTLPNVRLSI